MTANSLSWLLTEIEVAEAALAELGDRERRLWERLRIPPEEWVSDQYQDETSVWVVAAMGRRCLYFNPVESGWGWGRHETWGEVSEYHCQQDEIQHAISMVLFAIDNGGTG